MTSDPSDPTVTKVDLAGVEATHYQFPGAIRPDYETAQVAATKRLRRFLAHIDCLRADLDELRDKPAYTVTNTANVLRVINVRDALDALDEFERKLVRVVGPNTATPQEEASS